MQEGTWEHLFGKDYNFNGNKYKTQDKAEEAVKKLEEKYGDRINKFCKVHVAKDKSKYRVKAKTSCSYDDFK